MSVDPFADVAGQSGAKRILRHALERPHHAYLLIGAPGLGAHALAERFVRALAGVTPEQVLSAHPDIAVLAREQGEGAKQQISVESVRELRMRVAQRPVVASRVIAYLPDADRLNDAGSNALLKCLEEPPADAVFVLVARDEARLPATIRSRVVALNLSPVASGEIDTWLKTQGITEGCDEAIRLAAGRPGRALHWLQDAEERVRLAEAQRSVDALLTARQPGDLIVQFEATARRAESSDDPVGAWQQELDELMQALRERLGEQPEQAVRIGQALVQARRHAGSPVSPRIWLELECMRNWKQ